MLIVHITDFHVGRIIETEQGPVDLHDRMLDAVEHLKQLDPQPDLVMLTGDLSNHGNEADYIRVREALRPLKMPIYIIPGNHDRRRTLRRIFADHDYWPSDDKFIHFTLEEYPLRIIALDTLSPGEHGGLLCRERLAWVEARLEEGRDRPTAVFMHHPPFKTGLPYPDGLMCRNGDAFGEIVARHPQIQAVICGHVHRDVVANWQGTIAIITTSATFSNGLILHEVDDVDPLFEPPACRLFLWQDGVLRSHISFIGQFAYGLSEGVPKPPENE
ncbi:MAG: phosphodiesterase [Anaerolineae bacterium]